MAASRDGGSAEPDEFDRIVAGLELSMPSASELPAEPAPPSQAVFDPRMSDPLDQDDDLEHFVPDEVSPGPALTWSERLAWVAVLGGPTLLVVATVLGLILPRPVSGTVVVAFVGAIVWLIGRRGNHDRDEDPDNGAVL
ncbi:MAG: hypothetical protein ACR2FL_06020 [Nocardioidaceae bacterium]